MTLLEAIEEFGFDCLHRRRPPRRGKGPRQGTHLLSFRDEFGQWDPKNQRPELWNLYNARSHKGREHPRLPDLELDRVGRLAIHRARGLELPSIYFAHTRPVVIRQGAIVPVNVPW